MIRFRNYAVAIIIALASQQLSASPLDGLRESNADYKKQLLSLFDQGAKPDKSILEMTKSHPIEGVIVSEASILRKGMATFYWSESSGSIFGKSLLAFTLNSSPANSGMTYDETKELTEAVNLSKELRFEVTEEDNSWVASERRGDFAYHLRRFELRQVTIPSYGDAIVFKVVCDWVELCKTETGEMVQIGDLIGIYYFLLK